MNRAKQYQVSLSYLVGRDAGKRMNKTFNVIAFTETQAENRAIMGASLKEINEPKRVLIERTELLKQI